MGKKNKAELKTDFSSFLPILIMTIGCLITLLIINVLIIVSNPQNVRITSIVRSALYSPGKRHGLESGAPFPFGNREKEPAYIDVQPGHLVLYPGKIEVSARELELRNNPFERFLARIEKEKDTRYIVLLVRPRSARIARRLKKIIHSRDVDVGYELFEAGREVDYEEAHRVVAGR